MATDPRAANYDARQAGYNPVNTYGTDPTYEQKAAFSKATAALTPAERDDLSRFFAMQHQRGVEATGQTMDPGVRAIDTTPDKDTFAAVASGTARSGEQEADKKEAAVRAWLDTPEAKRFLGPPVGPAAMGPMGPPPGGQPPMPNYGPPGTISPGGPPGGGGARTLPLRPGMTGPPQPWGGGPPLGLPPTRDPRGAMLEELMAAGRANPDYDRGGPPQRQPDPRYLSERFPPPQLPPGLMAAGRANPDYYRGEPHPLPPRHPGSIGFQPPRQPQYYGGAPFPPSRSRRTLMGR